MQVANFWVCFHLTLPMQTVPTDLKQDYTKSLTNTLKQHITHIAADASEYKKNGHQEQPDLHAIHPQQRLLPKLAAPQQAT